MEKNKNVLIVNFNTQKLTDGCIKSLNKHTPGCNIFVFDNSDKEPFVNTFDNVTVIDNTKGQIINFNEWLATYPTNKKSFEATRTRGSAKHCYTVETCLSLIPDGFVLLDSDVLVKKDISSLWDDQYIYCADVITQPGTTIKRALPYICYINSKMCLENGVHYFDENYMHGLHKTTIGDRYDTGSGFYLQAKKFTHKEFKHEDYIIHYKGGSWFDTYKKYEMHKRNGKRNFLTEEEWLNRFKFLYDDTPVNEWVHEEVEPKKVVRKKIEKRPKPVKRPMLPPTRISSLTPAAGGRKVALIHR